LRFKLKKTKKQKKYYRVKKQTIYKTTKPIVLVNSNAKLLTKIYPKRFLSKHLIVLKRYPFLKKKKKII